MTRHYPINYLMMNKYCVVLLCIIILTISYVECKGGRGGGGRIGGSGARSGSRGSSRGGKSGGNGLRRSSSTAGLTGSALGLHLGHKIGHMNSVHSSSGGVYIYSVSHYYHKEDRPLVRNSNVDVNNLIPCDNITFCPSNSHPLCLSNGTVYCVTPMSMISDCVVNSTTLRCVNTTLSAPCLDNHDSSCNNSTVIRNETAQIPCVTNLFVCGNIDGISSQEPAGSIQMNRRDLEEYCVTVIADPLVDYKDYDNIIGFTVISSLFMAMLGATIYNYCFNKKKANGNSTKNRL